MVCFQTDMGAGVWDAEGGGGKTGAESAALHGFEINTAHDLEIHLPETASFYSYQ